MEDLRNKHNIHAPRAKGAYLEDAPPEIWTEPGWFLEHKMDGNRVTLQLGATESLMIGRNRQDQLKGTAKAGAFRCLNDWNQPLAAVTCKVLDGTVLDGELTEVFKQNGGYDKATVARVKNGDFVGYSAWTVLFFKGEDVRNRSENDRRKLTQWVVNKLNNPKIKILERVPATKENLKKFFTVSGVEGAIAKHEDAIIPAGQRTNPYWWKLKGDKKRTVDAFVIGVTEAKEGGSGLTGVLPQLNGKAASFVMGMMWKDGKIVEVGKLDNMPDDAVEEGLKHYDRYHHRVVEMVVSGWDGDRLRWPRFVKFRSDKSPVDCIFEEQVGGKHGTSTRNRKNKEKDD